MKFTLSGLILITSKSKRLNTIVIRILSVLTFTHCEHLCFLGDVNDLGGSETWYKKSEALFQKKILRGTLEKMIYTEGVSREKIIISMVIPSRIHDTLSEKIAHPTVYHHLSQLSVDIQLNGLVKCKEDSGVQMKLNLEVGKKRLKMVLSVISCSSVSCLINTEPLELLRLQPNEPIASESVVMMPKTDPSDTCLIALLPDHL